LHFCLGDRPIGFYIDAAAAKAMEHSHPGLLCRAMEIDRRLNAQDLLSDDFYIATPEETEPFTIVKRPRIGVDYAGHWAKRHLRFYIKGNPFVSRL